MNDVTEVEYCVANNSIHGSEPKKATTSSGGYDLFAAEEKNFATMQHYTCYN